MISEIENKLRKKEYRFKQVRCVEVPKAKGGTQLLGVITIQDRIVYTAMKLILEKGTSKNFSSYKSVLLGNKAY